MPHQLSPVEDYHEGDALFLRVTVADENGVIVDLTGADAEWLLKEDLKDPDAEAAVTKETPEADGIEITDETAGELTVHIETGDTDDLVDWENEPETEVEYVHRLRITDDDGNRSTVFDGEFTIHV